MATYITLFNWTDKGIAEFRDTIDRVGQAREAFSAMGVNIKHIYWTLGDYDVAAVIEAPDDETATAALLRLGSAGKVRTSTLRAFTEQEMRQILQKAG